MTKRQNHSSQGMDEEYLRALAYSTFTHLPKEIRDVQIRQVHKDVDFLIEQGVFPHSMREFMINERLNQFDPEKSFRTDALNVVQRIALDAVGDKKDILKRIPVGLLGTLEMNGFAALTPYGGTVIALNSNFWSYLRLFFTCIQAIALRRTETPIGNQYNDDSYINAIHTMAETICREGLLVFSNDEEKSISSVFRLPNNAIQSSVVRSLVFIMLHEYGHVIRGHLDHGKTKKCVIGNNSINIILTEQQNEFDADEFAATHIWGMDELSFFDNTSTAISVAMMFFVFHLLEMYTSRRDGDVAPTSHPAAITRLDRILNVWAPLTDNNQWREIQEAITYYGLVFRKILLHTQ